MSAPVPVPRLAVLAVCLHEGRALLVQRKNPPDALFWGFPGGKVEFGERLFDAALRELREETGVEALALADLGGREQIIQGADGVAFHYYCVAVLCGYVAGEARADDDACAAEWLAYDEVFAPDRVMSAGVGALLRLALAHPAAGAAD